MSEPAKEAQEIKREFQDLAYMIVHQLKEPVRLIRSEAELLIESEQNSGLNREGSAPSALCARRILQGALRLDEIATSLAQYADDLSEEDELAELTNAEAVLRAVRQKLQSLIAQTQATVTNEALPKLECQPSRFSRLMEHLLRNAINYRREEVSPLIHISASKSGTEWLFSISDNGTGIEPAYLEHVFEPFRRLTAKRHGGLGIGLTICRRIVTRHGGRIWLESEPGAGSTVFFTLPD